MNIVSTSIPYNSSTLKKDLLLLHKEYPFLDIQSVGNSIIRNSYLCC